LPPLSGFRLPAGALSIGLSCVAQIEIRAMAMENRAGCVISAHIKQRVYKVFGCY
jgi:hypothetical protein